MTGLDVVAVVGIAGGAVALIGILYVSVTILVVMWRLVCGARECSQCGERVTWIGLQTWECPTHGRTDLVRIAQRRRRMATRAK